MQLFKRNLLIAFRNFKKSKATTAIHILGLAVGISASLVIFLIVRYDFSFDKWEPEADQIYRLYTQTGTEGTNAGVNLLAPDAIRQNVTGISHVAQVCAADFLNYAKVQTKADWKTVSDWGATVFVDANYFNLFPYQWLAGSPGVLNELNTIVLSTSEAGKFFPGVNYNEVVGKVISFDDSVNVTVRGIVQDQKQHTDFKFDNFISLSTFTKTPLINSYGTISWSSVNGYAQCLVRLVPGVNPQKVGKQIKDLYLANTKDQKAKWRQLGVLQPLSDVHFNMKIDGRVSKSSLLNLGVLALLLLLLAAINFINLSTAQSTLRAREIGVRKSFGSSNKKIIYQFLTETFVLTVLATVLALLLAPFLLHVFKGFVPDGLNMKDMLNPVVLLFLMMTIILVTFLAGLYPAFVLTQFKPVEALKNQTTKNGKTRNATLRQVLTVSQFVIAQIFLIVVVVIGKQIHFMMNKDLGFRKDAIISFYIPDGFTLGNKSHKSVLLNDLRQVNGIQDISISTGMPTRNGWNTTSVDIVRNGKKENFDNIHTRSVDDRYLPVFDLKLLAGKNIQVDTSSRMGQVMINETFMHQLNVKDPNQIIGQYMFGGGADTAVIVGVLKDFTTQNLHFAISPTVVFADNHSYGYMMSILLDQKRPDSWPGIIATVEKKYKTFYPNIDFNYSFYDESLEKLYNADQRLSTLLMWATGLAIFISCLGLLGLVSFMANQRTKEIGIRKVLGASVGSIIGLLSRSMVKLVLLAAVIAFPFAWYFSNKWLRDFAFRTKVGWSIFFICAAGMLLIALMVLCLRTLKAARANPVQSLRDE
ncbi:duplicated orphan permease [Arachidicoccus rhizosphaerae]|jgi:predicted permease|uniref:Duplicated orphan permease n=1 Tax=Arachidicoccus rhizosphaerae TaxID=551991 RepID=A0A1H4CJ45_9BACT|nr:FtsX-like permease family protein [Arachidicoccus rhizosphaerae]SEA60456.1 duplicated orphan permease [Arachidicoccus rhizosphaerae]